MYHSFDFFIKQCFGITMHICLIIYFKILQIKPLRYTPISVYTDQFKQRTFNLPPVNLKQVSSMNFIAFNHYSRDILSMGLDCCILDELVKKDSLGIVVYIGNLIDFKAVAYNWHFAVCRKICSLI